MQNLILLLSMVIAENPGYPIGPEENAARRIVDVAEQLRSVDAQLDDVLVFLYANAAKRGSGPLDESGQVYACNELSRLLCEHKKYEEAYWVTTEQYRRTFVSHEREVEATVKRLAFEVSVIMSPPRELYDLAFIGGVPRPLNFTWAEIGSCLPRQARKKVKKGPREARKLYTAGSQLASIDSIVEGGTSKWAIELLALAIQAEPTYPLPYEALVDLLNDTENYESAYWVHSEWWRMAGPRSTKRMRVGRSLADRVQVLRGATLSNTDAIWPDPKPLNWKRLLKLHSRRRHNSGVVEKR
ncbi:MAG: hypothetical protein KDB14_31695 [Planctomycetales bacterium]|nr:hypothetical protein [Planctomycetales bacterium]